MESIFNKYGWEVNTYSQLHQGLINSTYELSTNKGEFILQSVNHHIFKHPEFIDFNINEIGAYLVSNAPDYLFTQLEKTTEGKTLIEWEGNYYRAFKKIDGYALSVLENEFQAFEAAKQFGQFTQVLSKFDAKNDPDQIEIDFIESKVSDHSGIEALSNLSKKYIEQGKKITLTHLSPECQTLMLKADPSFDSIIRSALQYNDPDMQLKSALSHAEDLMIMDGLYITEPKRFYVDD